MLEFALPNAELAAGTYWLALHNGPASQSKFEDFYWQTTNANATSPAVQQTSPFGSGSWATTNQEHTFELDGRVIQGASGEVPEPSTFILSGSSRGKTDRSPHVDGCFRHVGVITVTSPP